MPQRIVSDRHNLQPHPVAVHPGGGTHPHVPVRKGLRRAQLPPRKSHWGLWLILAVLVVAIGVLFTLKNGDGADPKAQASAVVDQMKAAASSRPMGQPLFGELPKVAGAGKEIAVTLAHVPPKVCVLASWELYRTGTVAVNGQVPNRVSASKWVDMCNEDTTATITWSPR